MRRYRFALDPVLRVRRLEEDAARAGFAAARAGVAAAEAALDDSLDRYEATPAPPGATPASAWLAGRGWTGRSAASVVAAGTAREAAHREAEDRRQHLLAARTRVGALERLDERRREDHARASRRAEDLETDELASTRYGRSR